MKHKIMIYGYPEEDKIRCFLFQTGIMKDSDRARLIFVSENSDMQIRSYYRPEISDTRIYVSGSERDNDFNISDTILVDNETFKEYKKLEKEYNERNN